jgi:hypothetical protein
MRNQPPKDASLLRIPKIAFLDLFGLSALAGDDEDVPEAAGLTSGEETPKSHVGVLLPQAVKIQPRVDFAAPPRNPSAYVRIERRL